jgi:tRNA threonylcarbamoyladenosine biosynthesis protein TsaB
MAYILHLETATKVCSVALSNSGKMIALKSICEDGYAHGENLTLLIQDVLSQSNISLKDLNAISVSSGPGSYTGLRIGVSTAKGICYALNIPLIAIDSLLALAELGRAKYPNDVLCPCIDARRMEIYNAFFSSEVCLKAISADIIEENSYKSFEPFIYFGDGAAKLEKIWGDRKVTLDNTIVSCASGQIKVAYKKYKQQTFEDVAYFEPFYLKDFITK